MPWKESHRVLERANFIKRLNEGERMSDLCREFGISRKTGYKIKARYEALGQVGLLDQSRRPDFLARKTAEPVTRMILELRQERPTWGAAKIREFLQRRNPNVKWPVRSTVHAILDKHGLVKKRRRNRCKANPTPLRDAKAPNELWCVDYKGQFRLGNKKYCYPLTITDYASRYLVCCEGLEDTKTENAFNVFDFIFKEYGLPKAIRSDNGTPFSSRSVLGLSRLSVWWLKLGIDVERIQPGKPQQNGRHERMHLTLKQETTRPPGDNLLQQQERFDRFQRDFNEVRPHEALGMQTPASKYKVSDRKYLGETPEPEYPDHDFSCYVNKSGMVYVPQTGNFLLAGMLYGEHVGLKQEDDGLWRVTFASKDLGFFDSFEGVFHPAIEKTVGC